MVHISRGDKNHSSRPSAVPNLVYMDTTHTNRGTSPVKSISRGGDRGADHASARPELKPRFSTALWLALLPAACCLSLPSIMGLALRGTGKEWLVNTVLFLLGGTTVTLAAIAAFKVTRVKLHIRTGQAWSWGSLGFAALLLVLILVVQVVCTGAALLAGLWLGYMAGIIRIVL